MTVPAQPATLTDQVGGATPGTFELSFVRFVGLLLRWRRFVLRSVLGGIVMAVVLTIILPRPYTVTVSFFPNTPQGGGGTGVISGLAAQFGVQLGAVAAGETPDFYADLATSRQILLRAVDTVYTFKVKPSFWARGDSVRTGTLMDLLEIERPTLSARRVTAIKKLFGKMTSRADPATGIVYFSVSLPWAPLSQQVSRRILDLVNRFDVETRQSQGGAERRFSERRLAEAKVELRQMEDSLQRFLTRNRDFRNSPTLQFQQDRLQREVNLRQSVVVSLAQSYEQARIQEVHDTPVLTVMEAPELPMARDRSPLIILTILGVIVGGMFGVLFALAAALLSEGEAQEPDAYADLQRLRGEMMADLRRYWARVRKVLRLPWRRRPA